METCLLIKSEAMNVGIVIPNLIKYNDTYLSASCTWIRINWMDKEWKKIFLKMCNMSMTFKYWSENIYSTLKIF